jgi:RimJ/RimL family protein N-acetyltransferase
MAPRFAPTLTDGVVTLRPHRLEDAPRVVEQSTDPQSVRWTSVPVPYGLEDGENFVAHAMPAGWERDVEWGFAVEVDGRYGGTVSLRPGIGGGRAELAYGAHPDARGTGAMERALRLLLEWGFEEQRLATVFWTATVGNWASRHRAWRVGFVVAGTLPRWTPHHGEHRDSWIATLSRDDPRQPRTAWLDVPTIEGDGFRLRRLRDDDAPRIEQAHADPEAQRWLGQVPAPFTEDLAIVYLERRREMLADAEGVTWAVADPEDDRLLGTVQWFHLTPGVECEVGYLTHPDARGRGTTTKAVEAVTQHCFDTLGVRRVTGLVAKDNQASRRVLERAGFGHYADARYAAWVREGWVDAALYDVTAEEWTGRSIRSVSQMTAKPASDSTTPSSSGER